MKNPFRNTILGATALFFLASAAHAASTISVVNIPATGSDAGSGISTTYTYTHALDFVNTVSGTRTINGVTFQQYAVGPTSSGYSGTYTASGATFTIAASSLSRAAGPPATGIVDAGGMRDLLTGLTYGFEGATTTVTLNGLTAGTDYSTRVYYRRWDTVGVDRRGDWTFNGDGTNTTLLNINQNADNLAHYIQYDFTASGTSMTLSVAKTNVGSAGAHIYGLTNHVIPEPSAILLGSLGMLGLLRRRRVAL